MKRKLGLLMLLIVQFTVQGYAQELDRRSMTEVAKGWESKKYITWYNQSGMLKGGTSQSVNIVKNKDGEVTEIRLGPKGVPKIYKPYSYAGTKFIDCYFMNSMNILYLTDKSIVKYSLDREYNVKEIEMVIGKRVGMKKMINEIQVYRDYRDVKIEDDRDAIKLAEIEHRKKYTLEGKKVADLKIVFPKGKPDKLVDGISHDIGIEVTLKNGDKFTTSNIGGHAYMCDFEIVSRSHLSVSGLGSKYTTGPFGANSKTNATISGTCSGWQDDNKMELTIKSKYSDGPTASLSMDVYYSQSATASYAGTSLGETSRTGGTGANGGNASSVVIQVKQVKQPSTGQLLHIYKVNRVGSTNSSYFVLEAGGKFEMNINGGTGERGGHGQDKKKDEYGAPGDGGLGGDGGNGGDATLIIDPSVTVTYNIKIMQNGGQAGYGGKSGTCWSCPDGSDGGFGKPGSAGLKGETTTKKQKVDF